MAFQFLCPQGHLLEGEEAHMGMACQCPQCGVTFLIPTVAQQAVIVEPESNWAVEDFTEAPSGPVQDFTEQPAEPVAKTEPPLPDLNRPGGPDPFADAGPAKLDGAELINALDAMVLHIPCPNGHELEAPQEMIGNAVICPYCSVQFKLRRENSIEYREHQEFLDTARAQFWFKWSIIIGVTVGLGLLIMIIMAVFKS